MSIALTFGMSMGVAEGRLAHHFDQSIILTLADGALEAHVGRRGGRAQADASACYTGLQIELKGIEPKRDARG